jgi:hypothetical protein
MGIELRDGAKRPRRRLAEMTFAHDDSGPRFLARNEMGTRYLRSATLALEGWPAWPRVLGRSLATSVSLSFFFCITVALVVEPLLWFTALTQGMAVLKYSIQNYWQHVSVPWMGW